MNLANSINVRRSNDGMVLIEFAFVAIDEKGGEELDHVATVEIPQQTASALNSQLTNLLTSAES